MRIVGLIAVIITGTLLLSAVEEFPDWGDPHSPANAGVVSTYYLEHSIPDTNVPNVVTSVLADYRGYDTMFETVVIFTAGIAIIAILRVTGPGSNALLRAAPVPNQLVEGDQGRIIIGTTVRLIIPVIQLFALYVVAHGHHSPGGGFQGGVILGSSFILLAVSRNLEFALERMSERKFLVLACTGILIYSGFGLACQFLGSNFLDYQVLHRIMPATDAVMARSHSMLGVEIGVAFTVTAIMFAIYANLSSAGRLKDGL